MKLKLLQSVLMVGILSVTLQSVNAEKKKDKADLKAGKKNFETTCFVCHGKDGKGLLPGMPDMTGKKSPLKQDVKVMLKRVIKGYQSPGALLAMPPKGGNPNLTEKEIRNIILYMKKNFTK